MINQSVNQSVTLFSRLPVFIMFRITSVLLHFNVSFHKVVRQPIVGAVEDFMLPYSAVYLRIQKWKNYWNRSTFAKVIVKIKVAPFLWPTVYVELHSGGNRIGKRAGAKVERHTGVTPGCEFTGVPGW